MPQEYKDLVADGPWDGDKSLKDLGTFKELVEEHPLCAGCNLALVFKTILASLPNPAETVLVGSTGCSSLIFMQTALHNIHGVFGNQNAMASGLKRALELRFPGKMKDVVVMAGDGATADIGLDMTLHSWFRGEKITTVMFDNELYANTGGQESGMTPFGKKAHMAPKGKRFNKVNMLALAKDAGCCYVAAVTSAKPFRIGDAIRKAVTAARTLGPTYVQIFTPCPTNLKISPEESIKIAKEAESERYAFSEYMSEEAKTLLSLAEKKK
jgi:pyruvate ferredoxin oxidoreductase beta subunit